MKRKTIITALFSLILALFIAPSVVSAEEYDVAYDVDGIQAEELTPDAADGDELFEQYFDMLFYGTEKPAMKKPAADSLTSREKGVFDVVKATAKDIADGNANYAEAQVPASVLGINFNHVYSAEELGLDYIYDASQGGQNPELTNAIRDVIINLDTGKIMYALFADCPYEFYWQRGTFSFSYGTFEIKMVAESSSGPFYVQIKSGYYSVKMVVDSQYRVSSNDLYTVNTEKTGAAQTAVSNAQGIVQAAASKTDYNKLVYYKDQICSLVSYDDNAVSNGDGSDAGPWAMIYVFDNSSSTNVVCEGYMEAFQYLCDQTQFNNSNIASISVRGTLNGEGHGWNVVHMNDGKNYIADVTNSDSTSIGNEGQLFLKGMTATSNGYKKVINNRTISYEYTADTTSIFNSEDLAVSSTDYIYEESHIYGQPTIIEAPTCTEPGLQQKVCSRCGDIVIETTPATGHSWGSWTYLNETQHKHVCGNDSSHFETADHSWNNGVITKNPTCTETGIKTYTCSVCSGTKTETLPALQHSWGAWTYLNVNQHKRVCTNDSGHVETANHSWNNGEITKNPTCTETGIKTYTCSVCSGTKTETIDALQHNWGAWTYLNANQHQRVCANDASHKQTADHSWNNGVITKNPTCTETGVRTYTCSDCSGTKTEIVPALQHDWGPWTPLDENQHQRVCGNDSSHVDKADHTWNEGEVITAATYTDTGVSKFTCTACGQTKIEATPVLEKADQPMTVKASPKSVKAKTLKKKAVKVAPLTVKSAEGTVSYKVTGGNAKSKKALSLNKTNGKITVKKKTKKGTYKINVTVTAAGNDTYKAGSVTKTVTVKVK